MGERRKRSLAAENPASATRGPPLKLSAEDIRKLVEVFRLLERWKREDDEKTAAARAK
jgi:hypothetical protein